MRVCCALAPCLLALACADPGREGDASGQSAEGGISLSGSASLDSGMDSASDADAEAGDDGEKLDVGATGGMVDCPEGQICDDCVEMEHTPCDGDSTDPFRAIGLNCPGTAEVQGTLDGSPMAIGLRVGFGSTQQWAPREGSKFVVLGSGLVADLDIATPPGDLDVSPTHCNDDVGAFDPGPNLPAPLRTNDVGGDCTADAGLLGTGDCSNTIHGQFSQGGSANDYVEMRFELDVPPDVISFSYDFAFFSTEYPYYFGSEFNDMYIGWLQSELWTGNISFDAMGNPISLNAGFLQFKDDAGNTPELDGTCMRQHAGTDWLTTTAGVMPGEHITVALAIFDLSDSILDSYAFIDNFAWGCDPTGTPSTEPEG